METENRLLATSLNNVGSYLMAEGKLEFAEIVQKAATVLDPINANLHAGFALALLMNKKRGLAIKSLEECLRINPYHTSALQLMGNFLIEEGQIPNGLMLLEKDLNIYEEKGYGLNSGLIKDLFNAYQKTGQEEKGRILIRTYLAKYPDDENMLRLSRKLGIR